MTIRLLQGSIESLKSCDLRDSVVSTTFELIAVLPVINRFFNPANSASILE